MEPISSFAISIAAGIALNKFESKHQNVDKEIKLAFESALKGWSRNKSIKNNSALYLKKELNKVIEAQNSTTVNVDKEVEVFLDLFEKKLAEKQSAYNYLIEKRNRERSNEIVGKLNYLNNKVSDLVKSLNLDPRTLEKYLELIPFNLKLEDAKNVIESLYYNKEVSLELREFLLIVVNKVYEKNLALQNEIDQLKKDGNLYLANVFESIKLAIENRDSKSFLKIYENVEKKILQDKLLILEQCIESSISIFAYEETIKLFEKLIIINSSVYNYFRFALYLQSFGFINKAIDNYEKALTVHENKVNDPHTFFLYSSAILTNLGPLYRFKKEYIKAFEVYDKTLLLFDNLNIEEKNKFIENIAVTLNNKGSLLLEQGDLIKAHETLIKSYQLYNQLENKKSKHYVDFCEVLNNIALLNQWNGENSKAKRNFKEILKIYDTITEVSLESLVQSKSANILYNLGILYSREGYILKAIEFYEKASRIYKKSSNNNPKFLSALGKTLNNIIPLYSIVNQNSMAEKYYNLAEEIFLSLEKFEEHEINYVRLLINGHLYVNKNKNKLDRAKLILSSYPNNRNKPFLLEKINEIIKNDNS